VDSVGIEPTSEQLRVTYYWHSILLQSVGSDIRPLFKAYIAAKLGDWYPPTGMLIRVSTKLFTLLTKLTIIFFAVILKCQNV